MGSVSVGDLREQLRGQVLTPDDEVELVGGDGQGSGRAGHDTPILATASSGIVTQAGRLRVSYTVS